MLNRKDYTGAVSKEQINDQINSRNSLSSIGIIQKAKEDIAKKILSNIDINSIELQRAFFEYLKDLEIKAGKKIYNKQNISKEYRLLIEGLYNNHSNNFDQDYLSHFEYFKDFLVKYINTPYIEIKSDLDSGYIPKRETHYVKEYLSRVDNKINYPNSPSREIFFDEDIFYIEIDNSLEAKNRKCFFEVDASGVKNYFSINDIINYIDTFGPEIGLPVVDIYSIPEEIRVKYFPSINRKIKYHMHKGIIRDLRDKQEVLMYGFTDYENERGQDNSKKSGFIAEKLVELEFRRLASESGYDIKIEKGSIGEDQEFKVDLFIILQDKKTGLTIKDEIQITLRDDISLKQIQIDKRNKYLKQLGEKHTESELVKFMLNNLFVKMQFWKSFNRPIGRLVDVLDYSEQKTITATFDRLVRKMQSKASV